ncbi:MAG: carbamoyltransferase HypF [Pirellulaceae bacterium]
MTTTTKSEASQRVAAYLILTGHVQGIGLRPAVARFAQQLALVGHVGNTHDGVDIHVEGPVQQVECFERDLRAQLPAAAEISSLRSIRVEPTGGDAFVVGLPIRGVEQGGKKTCHALSARVPPDIVACDDCLAEVQSATDRRHRHPFTSCTACGPRYSIINQMPYEREQTSMAVFPLCDRCRDEYESPADRRFHSQTNACPNCGPQIWLRDGNDRVVARNDDALHASASAIRDGRIVAVRGLAGYQLLVDATSQEAVERLRQRKQRRGKPLAVMVASSENAAGLAVLDETERRLLRSPAGPIVVAAARRDAGLASSVTAGLGTVGIMLPTTPLHGLLVEAVKRPLVCTSANVEGEPLAFTTNAAFEQLCGIADFWLEHDRPIRRPIDDSVVRVIAGRPVTTRLARGYAPLPLGLELDQPLIALGGHQKTSIALGNGAQAVLGPHIGDLDTVATRQRFVEQLADLSELFGIGDCAIACDQHPDYFSTQWAEHQTDRIARVQHHHAHIVAGMLEHGWLERQVLGVSFDGSGFGMDGTIWGGEFLLATAAGFQRVGHLRPFSLPGGERAVREPWRVATALVREALGDGAAARLAFQTGDANTLLPVLRRPSLSPMTTSAGRLFDGVAALVLGIEQSKFEGHAAMLLESVCDRRCPLRDNDARPVCGANSDHDIPGNSRPKQLDWRPLVRQVLSDRVTGVSPAAMAMRFHGGLADAIFDLCRCYAPVPVVLGGGVFQNRMLVELLAERFSGTDQPLGLPGPIPPNDGGLAVGQLAVAATWARQGRTGSCV